MKLVGRLPFGAWEEVSSAAGGIVQIRDLEPPWTFCYHAEASLRTKLRFGAGQSQEKSRETIRALFKPP